MNIIQMLFIGCAKSMHAIFIAHKIQIIHISWIYSRSNRLDTRASDRIWRNAFVAVCIKWRWISSNALGCDFGVRIRSIIKRAVHLQRHFEL